MIRTRVWLSTLTAVLLVAGPVMAYSWPVLFGLPVVFGQEPQREETGKRPVSPQFDSFGEFNSTQVPATELKPARPSCDTPCCDLTGDCLTTWQKLWQQGRFREAYRLAQSAVQVSPDNLQARHALVVSQIVSEFPTTPTTIGFLPQCLPQSELDRLLDQFNEGSTSTLQWGTSRTLATKAQTAKSANSYAVGCDCPLGDCPLMALFEAVFGYRKETKAARSAQCPAEGCCQESTLPCPQVVGHDGCEVRVIRGKKGPTFIWIVREPMNRVTSAPVTSTYQFVSPVPVMPPHAVTLAIPSLPPGFVPELPLLPPPAFSDETAALPLPPPQFAPPPPPLVSPQDFAPYIPVPVPTVEYTPAHEAPPYLMKETLPRRAQATRFDSGESCEAIVSAPLTSFGDVRIVQQGGRICVSSPHCQAQCDRLQGGPHGELMLEGNVHFESRRQGQTLTIEAQRVMFDAQSGQFVVENGRGLEQTRMNVAPLACPDECPAMVDVRNNLVRRQTGPTSSVAPATRDSSTVCEEELQDDSSNSRSVREALRLWLLSQPTYLTPARVNGDTRP